MRSGKIDEINNLISEAKNNKEISTRQISDGYHTFGELYKHRTKLFCVLCNSYPELSWKSIQHFDNENDPMYEGDFIAGINTPLGIASYHVKSEYWDDFNIQEIERAPKYDGYDSDENLERLSSLANAIKPNQYIR